MILTGPLHGEQFRTKKLPSINKIEAVVVHIAMKRFQTRMIFIQIACSKHSFYCIFSPGRH